jgi:hypothetical protein
VINEVTSNGADLVELLNIGGAPVDLTDWLFADDQFPDEPNRPEVISGAPVLQPGSYFVLIKGTHHGIGLGGEGDAAQLLRPDRSVADSTSWGNNEAEISWCRSPNGTGQFAQCSPTFGAANP